MSLFEAFKDSQGPKTITEAVWLVIKGFCMGVADIIPGVSGGTVAFITGIYGELIDAIRSFDITFFKKILKFDLTGAIAHSHIKFLIPLLCGILTAFIITSRLVHALLNNYPAQVWALFFGLICGSIYIMAKHIPEKSYKVFLAGLFGGVFSYFFVGLVPVTTPDSLLFVFFCGAIAICAMILPGISGAFILLLLGKYEFITSALRNPAVGQNIIILGVFALGCVVGIMIFSRALHFFLDKYYALTIGFLTGFITGALRKVWPWKEVLDSVVIRGKTHVLQEANVLPVNYDLDFTIAVLLMFLGIALVLGIDKISSIRKG